MSQLDVPIVFPWEPEPSMNQMIPFKWRNASTSYEIYHTTLDSVELEDLLPHCLSVKHSILQAVSTETHRVSSLYQVFPRTLSQILQEEWRQVIFDSEHPIDEDEQLPASNDSIAEFNERVKEFVAGYSWEQDRIDVVQQLKYPETKTREMHVQTWCYRQKELNSYVDWLPGSKNPVTLGL